MIGKRNGLQGVFKVNTTCAVDGLHWRDLARRNVDLAFRGLRQHQGRGLQMPQTVLFMGDYLVEPSGCKHCDPNMNTDTHRDHVSSEMIPGGQRMHTRPLHSVNPHLITSREISTGLPAIFSDILLSPHPISLVGLWRLKFHSFLCPLSLPLSLSYKANPGRGWCEDQAEQGCEEYKHNFFYCPEGKEGGVQGVGRWGL